MFFFSFFAQPPLQPHMLLQVSALTPGGGAAAMDVEHVQRRVAELEQGFEQAAGAWKAQLRGEVQQGVRRLSQQVAKKVR